MATAKIILDTRLKTSDKTYRVKLRITDNRKSKYYPAQHKRDASSDNLIPDELDLNKKFSQKEFDRIINATRRTDKEKDYKTAFDSFEAKANACINKLKVFTFSAFEKLYVINRGAKDNLLIAYNEKIKQLKLNDQIGNAVNYQCAINSINKFKTGLKYADITPEFLKAYEKHMLDKGRSKTTVSMYLRTLRTMMNEAIADNLIDKSLYPFRHIRSEKKKYTPPAAKNVKKALTPENIGKLYYYDKAPLKAMQKAKDFWVFSYLCNGMNMKDILSLKWSNIDGDYIHYERAKTKDTKEEETTITVHLKDDAKAVIRKYGIKSLNPDSYVFPELNDNMNSQEKYDRVQSFTHHMNKNLAKICKDLGIPKISTYSARHSFATTLKKNNASVEIIREALGHSSTTTTKNYLASFDRETIKEATDTLIPQKQAN